MNFKKYIPILAAVGGAFLAHSAQAQTFYIEEDPIYLRFEQYTGASGNLSLAPANPWGFYVSRRNLHQPKNTL